MFQYVLFDLDGTLTDPKAGITSCVQYALADAGIIEPNLDKLEPYIGPPLTDSFREFYGFDDEQIKRAIDKYHERFDEKGIFENEIIEGIPELLKALKDAGICNYTIWMDGDELFGYYECEKGVDYALSFQQENPVVQKWEKSMEPVMQKYETVPQKVFDLK